MKVGILTFHRAHNYGAVLQCYALQETLKRMGHDVQVIDYAQPWIEEFYKLFSRSMYRSAGGFSGKFAYLKNGAMYSILCLGIIMCAEAFGAHLPIWFAPLLTICIVGIFLGLSIRKIKKNDFGVCAIEPKTE